MLADVTFTGPPLAVTLPLSVDPLPTATLPKLRLVGDTVSCAADVPVPESATLSVAFDALETIARLPVAAPAAVGENVVVKVTL